MHADKGGCPCGPHHLTQAQGLGGCIGSFYLVVSYILHACRCTRLACKATQHIVLTLLPDGCSESEDGLWHITHQAL